MELLLKESYSVLNNERGHAVAQLVEALQAGRSRIRFPRVSFEFFIDCPSGRSVTLAWTQPVTEMSTGNISGGVKAAGA